MLSRSERHLGCILAMLSASIIFLWTVGASAQDQPAPKWELYGGYSFHYPGGDVHGLRPLGLVPLSSRLESNPRGAGAGITYNFSRWFGFTLDSSSHWGSGEGVLGAKLDDAAFSNLSFGPKITFRSHHFSPFFEFLVGDHRLSPDAFHDTDKLGYLAGGGLDINMSRHVALRLIRADYAFSNYRFGPPASTPPTELRGVRLQTGLVFMFGGDGGPAIPPSAACSAEPAQVFAGEPVTVHADGSGFNPKRTIKYNWTGTGVKVAGTDASAQVDTTGLEPGAYQANAELRDGSKKGAASCLARFTVKQPRPPEISCSSDPQSVRAGGVSAIHSMASSADGRKLSYRYKASAGSVSGTDINATLNTAGAEPGPITVTCSASDDRNPPLTASATTSVRVEAPPPLPPPPPAEVKELELKLALHSIYFQTARPTEKDPAHGLMQSQQEILVALATDFNRYLTYRPDAHLLLSGHADPRGSAEYNKTLTERRVDRAKNFLVEHGVPQGDIEVRSLGSENNLTAAEIRQQIKENPDVSEDDRRRMLANLPVIVLANNRRVDIRLSTTGQQSVRRYPFNARDALSLISPKGVEKGAAAKKKPAVKKRPRRKP